MIVYHASKKEFINDVFNGTIADDIDHAFLLHLGRNTSPNEKLSWKNSMMHMYKVVNTSDIPDTSTIAIEYQIPLTSKRIDFIISGADENQRSNIVIIELKQWEQAKLSQKSGIIQTRFQHGESETAHLPTRLGRMPICFKTIMKQYVNRTSNSCLVRFYITIKRIILFLMNAMLNILRKHLFF